MAHYLVFFLRATFNLGFIQWETRKTFTPSSAPVTKLVSFIECDYIPFCSNCLVSQFLQQFSMDFPRFVIYSNLLCNKQAGL